MAVDTQLDNRDISGGIQMVKHRPGAVVDSPVIAKRNRVAADQIDNSAGKVGVTGSGILHVIEGLRKTTEIMDRLGMFVAGDEGSGHKPVRRNRKNRLRPWQ